MAFLLGEEIADVSDSLPEGIVGVLAAPLPSAEGHKTIPGIAFPTNGFEFGECHLDGFQVGSERLGQLGRLNPHPA